MELTTNQNHKNMDFIPLVPYIIDKEPAVPGWKPDQMSTGEKIKRNGEEQFYYKNSISSIKSDIKKLSILKEIGSFSDFSNGKVTLEIGILSIKIENLLAEKLKPDIENLEKLLEICKKESEKLQRVNNLEKSLINIGKELENIRSKHSPEIQRKRKVQEERAIPKRKETQEERKKRKRRELLDIEWHDTRFNNPKEVTFMGHQNTSKPIEARILFNNDCLFFVTCNTQNVKICGLAFSYNSSDVSYNFWRRLIKNGIPEGCKFYIRQVNSTMILGTRRYPRAIFAPSDNCIEARNAVFGIQVSDKNFRYFK